MIDSQGIIDLLDEAPINVEKARRIAFELIKMSERSDQLTNSTLDEFGKGFADHSKHESLKRLIGDLRKNDSYYRLLWCVLPTDEHLDGYGAEHYYAWASDVGLNDEQVTSVFVRNL